MAAMPPGHGERVALEGVIMGRRVLGFAAVVALVALGVTGVGVASPAAGQDTPPETRSVRVGFGGICEPVGTPYRPQVGSGFAELTVPTAVEQGETFTVAVDAVGGPPALSTPSFYQGTFAVTGGTPEGFWSSNFPTVDFDDARVTATAAAGSNVVVRLTSVSVRWMPPPGYPVRDYGQDCAPAPDIPPEIPVDPETTAAIPVVAATCLGRAATIVAPADQATVAGTPGDDVIVAWAAGATITPGGGSDRICARAGDGTLSYAGGRSTALVSLARGTGGDAGGGTVRFEGIADVRGSPRPDALVGDDRDNVLRGGAGGDLLVDGGGTDTLDGEDGQDLLVGDEGDTCTSGTNVGC